jgi:hypothetical protein
MSLRRMHLELEGLDFRSLLKIKEVPVILTFLLVTRFPWIRTPEDESQPSVRGFER